MIEESLLPMRSIFDDASRYAAFETANPLRERKINIKPNEKMNVIGHQHIAADSDSKRHSSFTVGDEGLLHALVGQQRSAFMRAERYEKHRHAITLKDLEARGSIGH